MKLLFCTACGDIVAPARDGATIRWCGCKRHAVWWEDAFAGILKVHDRYHREGNAWPRKNDAYILGITNSFLLAPNQGSGWNGDASINIADDHPESFLFKTRRHCIVRFRVGETGDVSWSLLPEGYEER